MSQTEEPQEQVKEIEAPAEKNTGEAVVRQRLRLRYRKDDVLRYIGHLDLIRLLGRWFRRSEIPYATSGFYSPKPRISFGPILPLGALGMNELLDVELLEGLWWEKDGIANALRRLTEVSAPREFAVALEELDPAVPNIARQARFANYSFAYSGSSAELADALVRPSMPYVDQRDKQQDLKPGIVAVQLNESSFEITGGCGGDLHLNPFNLAGYLRANTLLRIGDIARTSLLDARLLPL